MVLFALFKGRCSELKLGAATLEHVGNIAEISSENAIVADEVLGVNLVFSQSSILLFRFILISAMRSTQASKKELNKS